MRFVNTPPRESKASMFGFQYQYQIYYKTLRIIFPGEEVTAWYGDDFGRKLGLEIESASMHATNFKICNFDVV